MFIQQLIDIVKHKNGIEIGGPSSNLGAIKIYENAKNVDNIIFSNKTVWSNHLTSDLYKNYDNFIFANSSIMGPFMHNDYKGKWTDIYLNRLTDDIKLFGSTINTCIIKYKTPKEMSHVQSYIFAMNFQTLEYLIHKNIFTMNSYCKTLKAAIETKEIQMSQCIIKKGWNIGCLHKYYNGVDFRFKNKQPNEYKLPFLDDIMYPQYKDKLWVKEGLTFIKGNRIPIN